MVVTIETSLMRMLVIWNLISALLGGGLAIWVLFLVRPLGMWDLGSLTQGSMPASGSTDPDRRKSRSFLEVCAPATLLLGVYARGVKACVPSTIST